MPYRNRDAPLPTWMWFFLALPLGLIAFLLWQRQQKRTVIHQPITIIRRARYVEPDSIPIDTRPNFDMAEMEEAFDTDHVFEIPESSLPTSTAPVDEIGSDASPLSAVDNLQVIEGIGPKIAALLNQNGINSYLELAEAPIEHLDAILTAAKLRRIADPGTWSEQARLAVEGNWDGLRQLTATLKGGRRKA